MTPYWLHSCTVEAGERELLQGWSARSHTTLSISMSKAHICEYEIGFMHKKQLAS